MAKTEAVNEWADTDRFPDPFAETPSQAADTPSAAALLARAPAVPSGDVAASGCHSRGKGKYYKGEGKHYMGSGKHHSKSRKHSRDMYGAASHGETPSSLAISTVFGASSPAASDSDDLFSSAQVGTTSTASSAVPLDDADPFASAAATRTPSASGHSTMGHSTMGHSTMGAHPDGKRLVNEQSRQLAMDLIGQYKEMQSSDVQGAAMYRQIFDDSNDMPETMGSAQAMFARMALGDKSSKSISAGARKTRTHKRSSARASAHSTGLRSQPYDQSTSRTRAPYASRGTAMPNAAQLFANAR